MSEGAETKASPSKVLVTGGGGFLGGGIVKALLARGDEVRVFSRGAYPALAALGAEVCRGDIADEAAVLRACEGRDVVFHVAAKVGVWGDYDDFYKVNVTGTANVLAGCNAAGVGRLIYTSSPSAIFDGSEMEGVDESVPYPSVYKTHYPKTKAAAERLVKAGTSDTLCTITLRPHLIWGPEDPHLVPRILARAKMLRKIGSGTNKIDSIYIDNAITGHIQAADTLLTDPSISGRVYFLTNGEPIVLWDLINGILKAGGKPPVTRKIPFGVAYTVGACLEFLYKMVGAKSEPRMTRFVAAELAKSHWFDISAAKRDFGYDPKVNIEEGLKRLETWLASSSK